MSEVQGTCHLVRSETPEVVFRTSVCTSPIPFHVSGSLMSTCSTVMEESRFYWPSRHPAVNSPTCDAGARCQRIRCRSRAPPGVPTSGLLPSHRIIPASPWAVRREQGTTFHPPSLFTHSFNFHPSHCRQCPRPHHPPNLIVLQISLKPMHRSQTSQRQSPLRLRRKDISFG